MTCPRPPMPDPKIGSCLALALRILQWPGAVLVAVPGVAPRGGQPRIGQAIAYNAPMRSTDTRRPTLGIVSPFYNEGEQSPRFIARVKAVLEGMDAEWTLV
jgi:hypothetical protein